MKKPQQIEKRLQYVLWLGFSYSHLFMCCRAAACNCIYDTGEQRIGFAFQESKCICICVSVYVFKYSYVYTFVHVHIHICAHSDHIFPNLDQNRKLCKQKKSYPKGSIYSPKHHFFTTVELPLSFLCMHGHFLERDDSPPCTVKFSLKKVTAEYCLQLSQYSLKGYRTASCSCCSCCWLWLNNLIIHLKKTNTFAHVDLHATAGRGYNDPDDTQLTPDSLRHGN